MPVPCSGTAGNEHGQTQTAQQENATVTGGSRLGVITVPPRGAGPQLLRAGLLGEGIFNCKTSLAGRCRLAAREAETRRTGVARSGWHWQEVGRGDTLSGLWGDQGLTFWVLPLRGPTSSSGVQPHPGAQVWGSQVVRAPQTGKSCSLAVIFGTFSLGAFCLCLSPLQRREPAELKSQECQLWECSIASHMGASARRFAVPACSRG